MPLLLVVFAAVAAACSPSEGGDTTSISATTPELFPAGEPSSWGYAVAVMSQEGFPSAGVRRIRDVEASAQQWRIGGGDGSLNGTRIVDLLWPVAGEQDPMLTSAVPINSGDPNGLVPDEYGQVRILVTP